MLMNLGVLLLSTCSVLLTSACSTNPQKLTPSGNYVDFGVKPVAQIKTTGIDVSLANLRKRVSTSKLRHIKFGAGNCTDDTGTKVLNKGSPLSASGRQWMQYAMVNSGLKVATHGAGIWSKEVRSNVQNLGALATKKSITEGQRKNAQAVLIAESQKLLNQSRSPDLVVRCTWTKFDRNIKTGAFGAEALGIVNDLATNFGVKRRYQISNLAVQFEIVDNRAGLVVDSFEVEKQLIAFERSFAILGVLQNVGEDDIEMQTIPVTRAAEPINEAQQRMVQSGVIEAISRLLGEN